MEIFLETRDIKRFVKTYYKEQYDVKHPRVNLICENVRDKSQEIDLFHHDDVYYNIFFRARIKGTVIDHNKKRYKLDTKISEEKLKYIVREELSKDYDVEDLKFGYQVDNPNNVEGLFINFVNAKAVINEKEEKQLVLNCEK